LLYVARLSPREGVQHHKSQEIFMQAGYIQGEARVILLPACCPLRHGDTS
jgi:hypothetical protein